MFDIWAEGVDLFSLSDLSHHTQSIPPHSPNNPCPCENSEPHYVTSRLNEFFWNEEAAFLNTLFY